ncbi:MAG: nucleotidyl transferase AbiEii/AbiGii toxin family protein [Planctomycetes bacterium]|nr:nucleotidyl transferase AbiEii/AbiGii toxin family protein [Planctomycetota bacterium]
MRRDSAELRRIAGERGLAVEDVERVMTLMALLQAIADHAELGAAFALKGGAALNLFHSDLPRHSRDIDLNYVEDVPRDEMLRRRATLEPSLRFICAAAGVVVRSVPAEHAGGKWMCWFVDHAGRRRNLEIDVSWLARVPLWPATRRDAIGLGSVSVRRMRVLCLEELAAGKLVALLERAEPRDVFDAATLLDRSDLHMGRLRTALVALGTATHHLDLRTADAELPHHVAGQVLRGLRPLVVAGTIPPGDAARGWVEERLEACRAAMRELLRLRPDERAFLAAVIDRGEVHAHLLDCDPDVRERIARHPGIRWRAENVARHLTGGA